MILSDVGWDWRRPRLARTLLLEGEWLVYLDVDDNIYSTNLTS